jgi:hypothetical protein
MSQHFPEALPHGDITEFCPDVFWVRGSMRMKRVFAFSRNMIILRQGEELTLVNTVRLDDDGLRKLDQLGRVTHVIKLGHFHDRDDPFYVDRYKAKFWAMAGHKHGLDLKADVEMTETVQLPVDDARLFRFQGAKVAEAIIHLKRNGGILICCDALQNWRKATPEFNWFARIMMPLMGFMKPANVGPAWLKASQAKAVDFERLQTFTYKHLLPAHGDPIRDDAYEQFSKTFERLFEDDE